MLIKIVAMFRNLIISSFDATIRVKIAFHPALASRGFASDVFLVNCVQKDHRDKINVPDPVVKDLISQKHCRTNNNKKKAGLISRSRKYIFQYFERHGLSSSGCV